VGAAARQGLDAVVGDRLINTAGGVGRARLVGGVPGKGGEGFAQRPGSGVGAGGRSSLGRKILRGEGGR
jgi:hypothetical protein